MRVGCAGLVTKMMKVTGPRKLQRKPWSGFSQQLGEKEGVRSRRRARGERVLYSVQPSRPGAHASLGPIIRHSLEVAAIALAVDRRRDEHNEPRHSVADQVEPGLAQTLAREHAYHEDVELHALEAHPAESGQEAVMQ